MPARLVGLLERWRVNTDGAGSGPRHPPALAMTDRDLQPWHRRWARFADNRWRSARALIGRRLQQGRRRVGSLGEASSPLWSRGLVMSIPQSNNGKPGPSPWQHCCLKLGSVSCRNSPSTEKKRCSHPLTLPPDISPAPMTFWSKGYLFRRYLIRSGTMHRAQSRESGCWIFSADWRKWREQSRVVKIDQTAGSDGDNLHAGGFEEKPTMRPIILEVSSDRGDSIAIQADDLTLLTDAELKTLRMSRADLQRRFAEGVKSWRAPPSAIGYDPAPMRPPTANGSSL